MFGGFCIVLCGFCVMLCSFCIVLCCLVSLLCLVVSVLIIKAFVWCETIMQSAVWNLFYARHKRTRYLWNMATDKDNKSTKMCNNGVANTLLQAVREANPKAAVSKEAIINGPILTATVIAGHVQDNAHAEPFPIILVPTVN